ncbi:MAG: hypothetical protein WBL50_17090 [Candidatus Acidiferrum sp.]
MYRSAIMILIGSLSIGTAAARPNKNAPTPASPAVAVNGSLANGSAIGVQLTKSIDSRKMKEGDVITARAMESSKVDGKTVIPEDAKLEGHVTRALARANGDSYSAVEFVFDKAMLKHGEEMPLNMKVRAIALPQSEVMGPPSPGRDTAPLGYGPPQGGADIQAGRDAVMPPSPLAVPDTTGSAQEKDGASFAKPVGGLNDNGALMSNSRGVYGLRGIGLGTVMAGNQPAAFITSMGKEVHLDSGTQLLLVAQRKPVQMPAN